MNEPLKIHNIVDEPTLKKRTPYPSTTIFPLIISDSVFPYSVQPGSFMLI